MATKKKHTKMIALFAISIGLIVIAIAIRINNDTLSVSMYKKNIELAHLYDAWMKITNVVDTDKTITTVKSAIDAISTEEGDDWCTSLSSRNKYRICNSLNKWRFASIFQNEIAIYCPDGIQIGGEVVYPAVTFGGERTLLNYHPTNRWENKMGQRD